MEDTRGKHKLILDLTAVCTPFIILYLQSSFDSAALLVLPLGVEASGWPAAGWHSRLGSMGRAEPLGSGLGRRQRLQQTGQQVWRTF